MTSLPAQRPSRREVYPGVSPRLPFLLLLLLVAGSSLLPAAGRAQSLRSAGPPILELPYGTRALALGSAFPVGGRDSDAVFGHPGLLNNAIGMTGAVQFWGRGGTLAQLSAGTEWWGGGAALGVRALAYGVGSGNFRLLPEDEGLLRGRGRPDGAAEVQVTGGYGRVVKGTRFGATATLLQVQAAGNRDVSGALGVGAARTLGPVVLSLAALNLGPGVSAAGASLDLAREVTLAASPVRARPSGPLDLNAAAKVSLLEDNTVAVGAGVELSWWPVQGRTFSLRGGVRSLPGGSSALPWTAGAGFQGDRLGIDYALVPFDSGVPAHRIGVHVR